MWVLFFKFTNGYQTGYHMVLFILKVQRFYSFNINESVGEQLKRLLNIELKFYYALLNHSDQQMGCGAALIKKNIN